MTIMIDTGNYIAAKAAIMARPDVVAASILVSIKENIFAWKVSIQQ